MLPILFSLKQKVLKTNILSLDKLDVVDFVSTKISFLQKSLVTLTTTQLQQTIILNRVKSHFIFFWEQTVKN